MKKSILSTLFSGLLGALASAAPIASFDFENYDAVDPTWWGNDSTNISAGGGDTSTLARIYDANNALPTGITSISPITFTVGGLADPQNRLEESARPTGAVNVTSTRYRWRLTGPVVTASFSVTIAPGYSLENFSLSLVQTGNANGTFAVTYNGIAMGSGILDSDDNYNGGNDAFTSNTIASSVSGTVNFLVSVDPNDGEFRTARWDNFVLAGDIVAPVSDSLALLGFSYDPSTGAGEVSIKGSPSTPYILVEADDLNFANPDQSPVPLTAATVGTKNGDVVTTDANGDATIQFNLGTAKSATFIRAEDAPPPL